MVPNHQSDPMVFLWFSYGFPMVSMVPVTTNQHKLHIPSLLRPCWTMLDPWRALSHHGCEQPWVDQQTMAFHTEMTAKWMMIVWDSLGSWLQKHRFHHELSIIKPSSSSNIFKINDLTMNLWWLKKHPLKWGSSPKKQLAALTPSGHLGLRWKSTADFCEEPLSHWATAMSRIPGNQRDRKVISCIRVYISADPGLRQGKGKKC